MTGKWLLLDDVFVKLLSGGLDIAVVQDIIDKLANPFAMLFHGARSLSLTLIAFCLNQCLALWQWKIREPPSMNLCFDQAAKRRSLHRATP